MILRQLFRFLHSNSHEDLNVEYFFAVSIAHFEFL